MLFLRSDHKESFDRHLIRIKKIKYLVRFKARSMKYLIPKIYFLFFFLILCVAEISAQDTTSKKDSVEESLEFKDRFSINYPLAFDHGKKITDLYNVWGTPTEFIIDINGIVQHRDAIPDKLEDYLAQWNKLHDDVSNTINHYYNLAKNLFKGSSIAS